MSTTDNKSTILFVALLLKNKIAVYLHENSWASTCVLKVPLDFFLIVDVVLITFVSFGTTDSGTPSRAL